MLLYRLSLRSGRYINSLQGGFAPVDPQTRKKKEARKMGSKTRKMTNVIPLRLTPELSERIHYAASEADETDASYIRSCVITKLELEPQINRRIRKRRFVIPDADVIVIGELSEYVARLNGAVIQLAKTFRLQSSPDHDRAEIVLSKLDDCYLALVKLSDRVDADFASIAEH